MKEIPAYYRKKVCQMKDCRHGDWVYDDEGRLCFVEITEQGDGPQDRHYSLHSFGIETVVFADKEVYPLSLTTMAIAHDMEAIRNKYHEAGVMCPEASRELREDMHGLMLVDDDADDCREQYRRIWKRVYDRFTDRMAESCMQLMEREEQN